MGTTNSKNTKQHKIQHERFEQSKLITQDQIQITVRSTLDDYNTWKSNLKKINFSNKENILFPLNHSFQQEGWCSQNTGFVKITYDNYPFVFEEQLQNRIALDKHLSQQEMWYLLYTLVSTAKDFSFINRKVGDVRPHNIFVNEVGQIKLAVCFSWPNQNSNLQKTMNDHEITYLSPEEMQICKYNKMQSIINTIASESFSIGLTLLHAGLLFNFSSIYNLQKLQINKKLLDQKILAWMNLEFIDENNSKVSYSQPLKEIISSLCIWDYDKREVSTEIFNLLQPHKQSILNIEPFEIKYKSNRTKSEYPVQQQVPVDNPLQRSLGFPVYKYTQLPKTITSNQTPISINQNYEWSTRTFTQVPYTKSPNYQLQLFDKYANSSSPQKVQNLNVKLTNTLSQRESVENNLKPQFIGQSYQSQPGIVTVRPFMVINNEESQQNMFRQINIHNPLEVQIEKKVQSKDFIHLGQSNHKEKPLQQFVPVQIEKTSYVHDSDFLRKIDEQIQKSKSMFPS